MINAGKRQVTAATGARFLRFGRSFAMIRGGHVDLLYWASFEVDWPGQIASWMNPAN